MFTGLVREIGTVVSLRRGGDITHLTLRAPLCAGDLAVGDSLATDGVCLTVTSQAGDRVTVDAVSETLRATTIGDWRAGRRVHLEPALRAGDRLGGHLVLGHVDAVGTVVGTRRTGEQLMLTIDYPSELAGWMLPKGSVAVNGVSLTLDAQPHTGFFTVNLIPHTLGETRFGDLRRGERVNLEADVLAKGGGRKALDRSGVAAGDQTRPLTLDRILTRGWRRRRSR